MEIITGILLSGIKYGEQDAVLYCYTKQQGFETFFVKNIYAKNSKKKPFLSPLNELYFSTSVAQKSASMKSISRIDACDILDIHQDIKAGTIVFFISDFLNIILRNEVFSNEVYNEILELREQIKRGNYQTHYIFLLQFLKIQGAAPYLSEGEFLNPEEGSFSSTIHSKIFGVEVSQLWKEILSAESPYQYTISPSARRWFLESIMVYYKHHIPNFRVPESLEIIKQILE